MPELKFRQREFPKETFIDPSEDKREGPAASFSMNEGGTYVVNIWRSAACGQGRIKNIDVEMAVKKVNP